MNENDPANIEEYNQRAKAGAYMSGQNMHVKVHSPCPFCGSPDWINYLVLDVYQQNGRQVFCIVCGRTGQFNIWEADGAMHAAVSLEAGPDLPDFLRDHFIDNRPGATA